jgi:hypothetical protein
MLQRMSLEMAHHVGYCGASECQLSGELRKSLARARKVEDDPISDVGIKQNTCEATGR